MKVLMLKDVSGVGNIGQIKEVKQGYAINYLIPNKMAVLADDATLKNFSVAEQARKDKEAVHTELAKKTINEIKDKNIIIKAKSSEKGKLFKSVHGADILLQFEKEHNLKIDIHWLPKNLSIKEIGDWPVEITKGDLTVNILVKVEAE